MMKEWRQLVGERRGLLLLSCDGGVVLQLEDEIDRVQHVTHAVGGVLHKWKEKNVNKKNVNNKLWRKHCNSTGNAHLGLQ